MTNNSLVYHLPKISTVSYYDVETDQNLTQAEWNYNQNSSEEITVVNKSGSNFRSEKEGYGPVFGAGEPGFKESMKEGRERERKRREWERINHPKEPMSEGEKIICKLVVGATAVALGPIGAMTAGTLIAMIGNNFGADEIVDIGFDMATGGLMDETFEIIKDVIKK